MAEFEKGLAGMKACVCVCAEFWVGDAGQLHAARRPGVPQGPPRQAGDEDEAHLRRGHHSQVRTIPTVPSVPGFFRSVFSSIFLAGSGQAIQILRPWVLR